MRTDELNYWTERQPRSPEASRARKLPLALGSMLFYWGRRTSPHFKLCSKRLLTYWPHPKLFDTID
jgi:hypothetical protein